MNNLFSAPPIYKCISEIMRSCHVIQQGETLWQISQQYNVPIEAVIESNPQIVDPYLIFPGQIIIIPFDMC